MPETDGSVPTVIPEFEPYLRGLGMVALSWSQAEFFLDEMMLLLANVDRQIGSCITSQMIGPGPRVRAIASLMRLRGTPQTCVDEFNSMAAEIESLGRQRNRFLHDQVLMHRESRQVRRLEITADRKPKYELIEITPMELHTLSGKIDNASKALRDLTTRITSATPSFPTEQFHKSLRIDQLPFPDQGKGSSA
jgi:hypothetical protein